MCYSTKVLKFNEGLFDNFIDITFVITMKDSLRTEKIIEEIRRVKPSKKVVIVYNSGYKNCKKTLYKKKVTNSAQDLVHAYKYIFNISQEYNNILILEDDAKFSDEIFESKHINNIETFINNNIFNTYSLGSIKLVAQLFGTHQRCYVKSATHAMIFSKEYRKNINFNTIFHIDILTNAPFNINGWIYYKTLVGQVCEKTENSEIWPYYLNNVQPILYYFTKDNCITGIDTINLLLKIFWILSFIMLLIILFIVCKYRYIIYNYFINIKNNNFS